VFEILSLQALIFLRRISDAAKLPWNLEIF